jgi:hypothetical protein
MREPLLWEKYRSALTQNAGGKMLLDAYQIAGVTLPFASDQTPPDRILYLLAIEQFLQSELRIWKAYHSIEPTLREYCVIVASAVVELTAGQSIRDCAQEIGRAFMEKQSSEPPLPPFQAVFDLLIENGFRPMLTGLRRRFDESDHSNQDIINRLDDVSVIRPPQRILADVSDLLKALDESKPVQLSETIRGYEGARSQVVATALRFTCALIGMKKYLCLGEDFPRPQEEYGDAITFLKRMAPSISHQNCGVLVWRANNVIMRALDIPQGGSWSAEERR